GSPMPKSRRPWRRASSRCASVRASYAPRRRRSRRSRSCSASSEISKTLGGSMDRTPRSVTLLGMLLAAPCSTAGELSPPCPPVSQAVAAGFDPQPYLDDLQEAEPHFLRSTRAWSPGSEPVSRGFSCEALGYTTGMQAAPFAALIPGYTPVKFPADN